MEKIVTVTLSPAVDKSTQVEKLVAEQKLKCVEPKYEPGGGGINVSRALKRLGTDSIAVFPSGGCTGQLLQELLEKEKIHQKAVEIKNETRENFIVVDTSSNQQYRFGMPGKEIYLEEQQQLASIIQSLSPKWLVMSGSYPPGIHADFLTTITDSSKRTGVKLIVDTSGEALRQAVDKGVYLLKPNLGELSKLVGVETLDNESVEDAAKELIRKGKCEIIIVSMGPKGACVITKDITEHIPAPAVRKLSTVGAGDSMVAGIIHALVSGLSVQNAARMGVACGTAATMNPGTELFKMPDVEKLYQWLSKDKPYNSPFKDR